MIKKAAPQTPWQYSIVTKLLKFPPPPPSFPRENISGITVHILFTVLNILQTLFSHDIEIIPKFTPRYAHAE